MFGKLRKSIFIFSLIGVTAILAACSIGSETSIKDNSSVSVEEQIATPFILKAADGYVNHDNYTTPHTYVIDTYQNEVYVDVHEEPSGLTPEEIIEQAKNADEEESIYPIYDLESLSAKEDSFTLQFDSKTVEFTALSESYYENEEGVRYILEPHSGIDKYIESFFD